MKTLAILLFPVVLFGGQVLNLDNLDRLASRANETVNVTLDASLLKAASGFLSSDDGNDSDLKKLVSSIRAITIRSFEFKDSGAYLDSDVEAVRSQLRDPNWKRVVQVHNKAEGDSDVYVKTVSGKVAGLAVIVAEPKQLTVVSIDGPVDVEGLRKLGGNFGIPKSIVKKTDK